jgi:hypothetical protein
MGFTRERLDGMSDRELEFLLAKIVHRHDRDEMEIRGEFLCYSLDPMDKDPSIIGRLVPHYVTTWPGFGEALLDINRCGFNIELYNPAGRSALNRAVVTRRWDEEAQRGEASNEDLRRALALAAILAMSGDWYEAERG